MGPTPKDDDDLVDEASEGSFPASDPPSFWAGAGTRDSTRRSHPHEQPPRREPHLPDASSTDHHEQAVPRHREA